VTVTSKGSPYAIVTMSCLSVNSVYNIDIYSDQMVGWIKDGVQVGLVPGNNVLGGLTDSASPPQGKRHCSGGGVLGVVTARDRWIMRKNFANYAQRF